MEIGPKVFERSQSVEIASYQATSVSNARAKSAPPRLETTEGHLGNSIFKVVDSPKQTSSRAPSPTLEEELAAALKAHQAAFEKEKQEIDEKPIRTLFFGANATADLRRAAKEVTRLREEKRLVDQAILASKDAFREWVRAQGGNPAIAEEVFEATSHIPDHPISPATSIAIEKKGLKDTLFSTSGQADLLSDKEATDVNSTWHDVDPDSGKNTEKTAASDSLSLENFLDRFALFSEKKLTDFIKSLSPENRLKLAKKYFDPAFHDELYTRSEEGLENFFIDSLISRRNELQQEIPLIERSHVHEIISRAFLQAPAAIEQQGVCNGGLDCYLSSALQCLRAHIFNFSAETQQTLLDSLRARYATYCNTVSPNERNLVTVNSPLIAFLEKKFDARDPIAASFLRLEVKRVMQELSESGTNSSQAAREVAHGIDSSTGNSNLQCDSSEALIALIEYVGTPPIQIKERDTYRAGDLKTGKREIQEQRENKKELLFSFGFEVIGEAATISADEMIHSNWNTELDNVEDDDLSRHNIHRQEVLANPPESFTISLKRFAINFDSGRAEKVHTPITGLINPITLPVDTEEGKPDHALYSPTSIICHYGGASANSGHYATYRKEGDQWYHINDALVERVISLDDPMYKNSSVTHCQFLERNAYIVNYRKIE